MAPPSRLWIDARGPFPPPLTGHLHLGNGRPDLRIAANSRYFTRNDVPWLPAMGEFHFSRYPADAWETEILKMKAGGLQIVATYVFWIHHEEIEGRFDFSGQRALRRFLELCHRHGLLTLVRIGPWAHGECRNGGFPDWLLPLCKQRQDDPTYLSFVRRWWEQLQAQLTGLYAKEGGSIIGIQLENELMQNAPHLLTLKRLAQSLSMDVPLYTATGWGAVQIPEDEVLPIYGGYPDGFWERQVTGWPAHYRIHYFFSHHRNDNSIGADLNPMHDTGSDIDPTRYPFATCELGGGMEVSYHRRPRVTAEDIAALAFNKIGSGGNLLGYYMYHGGVNPPSEKTTLNETQATGYWNDLPVLSYDFQAPLGAFGQVRPSYHLMRRLHLFLNDFGHLLAPMVSCLPENGPTDLHDRETLRWAVRSDGRSAFLFVNNHQRLEALPPKAQVQFTIAIDDKNKVIPPAPVTVPSGAFFLWPINLSLNGVLLKQATVQPLCQLDGGKTGFVFFAIDGITPRFIFDVTTIAAVTVENGIASTNGDQLQIVPNGPEKRCQIRLRSREGTSVTILLLSAEESLTAWKAEVGGQERLWLSDANLFWEGNCLHARTLPQNEVTVRAFPRLTVPPLWSGEPVALLDDGPFSRFSLPCPTLDTPIVVTPLREAGTVPPVAIGAAGVATPPEDTVFEQAALWEITFPPETLQALDTVAELYLHIDYIGDIARLYAGNTLLLDNFYSGRTWEIGLKRFADAIRRDGLRLAILPLRPDAPIYLPEDSRPTGTKDAVAILRQVVAIPERESCIEIQEANGV